MRNIFNYSNPEVDAILERFNAARRDSDAQNAYLDLHAKLSDELPYLFLWKLDTKKRMAYRGSSTDHHAILLLYDD